MVLPFAPIEIIETPEYGRMSAKAACEHHKVKSQNDKDLLQAAHDDVYKAGFYSGTMLVGPHKGAKVSDAKPLVRAHLIEQKLAVPYAEPTSQVISRSGDGKYITRRREKDTK